MKKLEIFCYGCKEVINRLDRCPTCGTIGDVGFEKDREWHWVCRLWASSKGWGGDPVSLPMWFQNEPPERLEAWKEFKARLLDVEALPLPDALKKGFARGEDWRVVEYWINNSGILPLQQGTLNDLLISKDVGSLVHRLATAYANYHKARVEEEEKAKEEKRAKEEQERLKGKKKPRLLQRRKERKTL